MGAFYYENTLLPVKDEAVEFEKNNYTYTYDDESTERSVSFSILRTRTTEKIFGNANDVNDSDTHDGIPVEYRYDSGNLWGRLWLVDYQDSDDAFEVVFTYGRPLAKTIKDLDKIGAWGRSGLRAMDFQVVKGEVPYDTIREDRQFPNATGYFQYNSSTYFNSVANGSGLVSISPYYQLTEVINACVTALNNGGANINVDFTTNPTVQGNSSINAYALVPPKIYSDTPAALTTSLTCSGINGFQDLSDLGSANAYISPYKSSKWTRIANTSGTSYGVYQEHPVNMYKVVQPCTMRVYKSTAGNNYVIVSSKYFSGGAFQPENVLGGGAATIRAKSGWKKWPVLAAGANAADYVDITLEEGTYFGVFEIATGDTARDPRHIQRTITFPPLVAEFVEQDATEITDTTSGATISATATLGELKLIDLLNTYGALTKSFPVYEGDETNGNIYFKTWSESDVDVSKPITLGPHVFGSMTVTPTFADYGQHNIVACDSADYVTDASKFRREYTIGNRYLEEEVELYTIPFNEGEETDGGTVFLKIYSVEGDSGNYNIKSDADKFSIVAAPLLGSITYQHINRVATTAGTYIDSLCSIAVQAVIDIPMAASDFHTLVPGSTFYWHYTYWMWIDGVHDDSSGIATLTLQRLK